MTAHRIVSLALALLLGSLAAHASTLEERKNEWAFGLSVLDRDDSGMFTEWDFDWSYIFTEGRFQLGVAASAFDNDFDDPALEDLDGNAIGPLFTWNWTPEKEQATGFLFASVAAIGGDAGDVFDSAITAGVGVKAFIGDSAAVLAFLQRTELQAASGFEDTDQTRLAVFIALYTHRR